MTNRQKALSEPIPKTVVWLGWAMMFINISYVMIFSLFSIYLMDLGVTQTRIGFLEGAVEATSQLMKLFSGILSDVFQKRKTLIVCGYALNVLSRPIIAFSASFLGMSVGRAFERIGNGIQGTPRDALVGDLAPKHKRGQCFGLKRSMGTFGSSVGCLIAFLVLKNFRSDIRDVFFLSIIPAFIAFVIIILKVREPETLPRKAASKETFGFKLKDLRTLGTNFALIMLVNGVFSLSRVGEAFLSIHGYHKFGLPIAEVPLILMIFNMGYTLSSYPIGFLADKTNRFVFLAGGIIALIMADLIFFNATSQTEFWIGVILWGVQMGVTMNIFTSLIVDIIHPRFHGTAFGVYFFLNAICYLTAETSAGYIAHVWSREYAYLISACIATISLIILMVIMKYRDLSQKY